jgi:hypothetical protein
VREKVLSKKMKLPIGVQDVYNKFEHENRGYCNVTARVRQRKPPNISVKKRRSKLQSKMIFRAGERDLTSG